MSPKPKGKNISGDKNQQAPMPAWQIREVRVHNFKSLYDFTCELSPFTCIVGLNGSGKTTLLQWLDFASAMMRRDGVDEWLKTRAWTAADLLCRAVPRRLLSIRFAFSFVDSYGEPAAEWTGVFSQREKRLTRESVIVGDEWYKLETGWYSFSNRPKKREVAFSYQGSLLSQVKESVLPEGVLAVKQMVRRIFSLEQLSPFALHRRSRETDGTLGLHGQYLSAYLHEIGTEGRSELSRELKQFYPIRPSILSRSLRSGWKQLSIVERFGKNMLISEAKQVNDGMLRVLAILAQLRVPCSVSIFDEVENGINPEIVERLVDRLASAENQVIVTTHSPMILNYLEDDVAKDGVLYLYKLKDGFTRAVPMFKIPSMSKKLQVMGPGEAFVDTNLTALGAEIEAMTETR